MSQHVLTVPEMARMGGLARAGKLDRETRRSIARRAYLTGAVNTVIARLDDLDPAQRERLTDAVIDRMAEGVAPGL
jgi:cell division inhibitor SulA